MHGQVKRDRDGQHQWRALGNCKGIYDFILERTVAEEARRPSASFRQQPDAAERPELDAQYGRIMISKRCDVTAWVLGLGSLTPPYCVQRGGRRAVRYRLPGAGSTSQSKDAQQRRIIFAKAVNTEYNGRCRRSRRKTKPRKCCFAVGYSAAAGQQRVNP